jgi:hypothetical protein
MNTFLKSLDNCINIQYNIDILVFCMSLALRGETLKGRRNENINIIAVSDAVWMFYDGGN